MSTAKIIISLQQAANTTSALDLAILSKTVEKLDVGTVAQVANVSALPTTLTTNGNLYYVVDRQEVYYNIGSSWVALNRPITAAYAWGYNGSGRLGDNTQSQKSSPILVAGTIATWSQLSAGDSHSLGVTDTGIAYAWGANGQGQLGDNSKTNRSSPVTVAGDITNWKQLAGGYFHSLGVTTTGIAYGWGYGSNGQLGSGTSASATSPVVVAGGITNWSQVSAGRVHSLGITSSGIAYAWGYNNSGRLGDNTTTNRSSPVTVVGGITNWLQLTGGVSQSMGVTSSGIAYGWGYGGYGRLGDGTTTTRLSPVTVIGGITNWSQLSTARGSGRAHSLGVTSSGIAYGWGFNGYGRIGDGTTVSRLSPVTVIGGITNWKQVSANEYHSFGVTSSGVIYSWGSNSDGTLGNNSTVTRSSPVTVVGGVTTWAQVSAGIRHVLGLTAYTK